MMIRKLEENDFDDVVCWRSDPTTMRMSKYTGEITKKGFRPVFDKYLSNPSFMVVGENSENKCVITLTPGIENYFQYEIGINMNPNYRGKGLAFSILQLFLEEVTMLVPDIYIITATIKQENIPSIKLFSKCNFHQITSFEPGYFQYIYVIS